MCAICENLQTKVETAKREGRLEKARILQTILDGHRANTCREGARYAAIVKWANGMEWIEGGEKDALQQGQNRVY